MRESTWAPIALRAVGIVLGMLCLAAIGAFASVRGARGHAVEPPPAPPDEWLATRVDQAAITAAPTSSPRAASSASARVAPEPKPSSSALTEDGKIILNLATSHDLTRLPGIGKKRAESILALREKLGGRFRRISDLLRIRGIGPRRLQQWAPLLVLDPPPPKPSTSDKPAETPPQSPPKAR